MSNVTVKCYTFHLYVLYFMMLSQRCQRWKFGKISKTSCFHISFWYYTFSKIMPYLLHRTLQSSKCQSSLVHLLIYWSGWDFWFCMDIIFFWDMVPFNLEEFYPGFRGNCYLRLYRSELPICRFSCITPTKRQCPTDLENRVWTLPQLTKRSSLH
jgi:hypothetical protein